MKTVLFLSNEEVKAIVGSRGRSVLVEKAYMDNAPKGSIVNGQVIDEMAFTAFLTDFWNKNQLPKQNVILVLGNGQAITRIVRVPKLSHNKLMEYLSREMGVATAWDHPVYTYTVLKDEGKMLTVSASAIERIYLEPHIKRFEKMGIRIDSIVLSHTAGTVAFECLPVIGCKPTVVQLLDGRNLLNVMYVDGAYFQHNSSRVFGERGTVEFGIESARSISHLEQFLKTEYPDKEVNQVFLGGEYKERDLEVCKDSIEQMNAHIDVEMLGCPEDERITFPRLENIFFANFTSAIGGLLAAKGPGNLLYEYKHGSKKASQRRKLIHSFIPLFAMVGLLVLTGVYLCGTLMWRVNERDKQLVYLSVPVAVEAAAEHDILIEENNALTQKIAVVRKTLENLETYPIYSRAVKTAIRQAAPEGTWANVNGYIMETGMVSVEAVSTDMAGIQTLVAQLELREDLFYQIDYSGFEQDDGSGYWKGTILCYLKGTEANRQEVTP